MQTPILITVASVFTFIWVLAIILLGDYKNLFDLKANEIGDFLAGAFSPLAFLWFLIAVFMQKLELRQARETHMLQLAEFKESTAANKDIAETGKRDAAISEMQSLYESNKNAIIARIKLLLTEVTQLNTGRKIPVAQYDSVSLDTTLETIRSQLNHCSPGQLRNNDIIQSIEHVEKLIIDTYQPIKEGFGDKILEIALRTTELPDYNKTIADLKRLVKSKITEYESREIKN